MLSSFGARVSLAAFSLAVATALHAQSSTDRATATPPSQSAPTASSGFSTANTHWMRDPHSGCWVYYRWSVAAITDISWSGQCVDSRASGEGTLTVTMLHEVETFSGNFENGLLSGHGTNSSSTGYHATGDFRQGGLNGPGIADWASGMHYEGSFLNHSFSGRGKLTWPGGDSYEGNFFFGSPHGEGTLIYADGWQFRGDFSGGIPVGDTIVYEPDGKRIEGGFVMPREADNAINRNPAFSSALLKTDEHVYVGFRYTVEPDGTVKDVVLLFSNGVPELDKATIDAVAKWRMRPATVNAVPVEYKLSGQFGFSHGERDWKDGGHYEGQFIDDRFDGQGAVTWPGGDKYVGSFQGGVENGHGTYTSTDGEIYEGNFEGGRFSGHGVLHKPNGTRLEGEFVPPAIDHSVPMPEVQYPPTAVRANKQGDVTLRYRVGADGAIKDVRILYYSGTQELDDEAVAEVFRTKMIPGTLNGKPVELDAVRKVVFRLQR